MSQIVFVPDPVEWERFVHHRTGVVQSDMGKKAQRLQRLARRQVGVETGALRRSIHVSFRRSLVGPEWLIGSENRIALLHHNGAKPHIITPKRARVLRFSSKGRIVYARLVHHPGTRPNRYLTDNLRRVVND